MDRDLDLKGRGFLEQRVPARLVGHLQAAAPGGPAHVVDPGGDPWRRRRQLEGVDLAAIAPVELVHPPTSGVRRRNTTSLAGVRVTGSARAPTWRSSTSMMKRLARKASMAAATSSASSGARHRPRGERFRAASAG